MLRPTGPGKIEEKSTSYPWVRSLLYNFDFDGSAMKPEHRDWLDHEAVPLLLRDRYNVWMRGTASQVGKPGHNLDLSQWRVADVERYLLAKGVRPSQIQTCWVGEDLSTSKLKDDERDRAVEVHLQVELPQPKPPPKPPVAPPEIPVTDKFRLRLVREVQVAKAVSLAKIAKYKRLAQLRFGLTVDLMFFEIRDDKHNKSAYYVYGGGGLGAGGYWASYTHDGPWNAFKTSKRIHVSQFNGFTRFTTAGAAKWTMNYLHLCGTPKGVDNVYMAINTGLTIGAGLSTTIGWMWLLQ